MVESHRQEIAKLEALYASNPGGRVFVHLAEALRRAGEQERARSILEEGLARHPDSASGYVVLGRVLIDRGVPEEAETAFRKVLQLDRGNLVALRCLGDLARSGGRPAEAVSHYRELIARNPSSAADSGLMRLVDELQRSAEEAQRQAQEAEAAAAAQAELEADEQAEEEAEAATVAPSESEAPGRAGAATPAEAEYGMVELAALPGDLASFAGLVASEPQPVVEEAEPEPRGLEDDVVVLIESSAAPLELEELETELAASPAEINPLSALPEAEPSPGEIAGEAPGLVIDTPPTETDASAERQEGAALDAGEAAVPGDMDVDAAMLDLQGLSTAAPYEVVPAATELTLVDDDSVRVPMAPSDEEAGATEVDAEPPVTAEAVTEAPAWAAAVGEVGVDDARTQDLEELAAAAAEDATVEEDLPWLVEPAEAASADFGGTGAAEEPAEPADIAGEALLDVEPEERQWSADDLEYGAPGEGALFGDIVDAGIADQTVGPGDDSAAPLDLTAEFEAPADEIATGAEAQGLASADMESAFQDVPEIERYGEVAETEPESATSETVELGQEFGAFGEAVEAEPEFATFLEAVEAEATAPAGPTEAEPEFVEFAEPVEAEPEFVEFAEPVEAEPEFVEFAEPVEAEPEFVAFVESVEAATSESASAAVEPELESFAEEVEAEPELESFAEDVEAEPELATFMEGIEAGRNAAGFVADNEFVFYDERIEGEPEPGGDVVSDAVVAEYLEDVEAEPELAGLSGEPSTEAEPESDVGAYADFGYDPDHGWLDEQLGPAGREAVSEASRDAAGFDGLEPTSAGEALPAGDADERAWHEEIAATGAVEPQTVPEGPAAAADELPEWARAEAAPSDAAGVSDVGTETLADLYLAQGFVQRAVEVYRALLEQRPTDERLATKLSEAEAVLATGRSEDTAEDAGEVWLRGVESAWTGGAGATGKQTTPYAWTEREEHEKETGIGAYLRELVGWGTGETPVESGSGAEPPVGAVEVPAAESVVPEERPPTSPVERGWLDEVEGEEGVPAADADRAGEPGDERTAAGPWSMAPERVLEENWSASEPAEAWPAPEEPPPDPWLAPEPGAMAGGPADTRPHPTAPNPIEEAFNEWFGAPPETAAPASPKPGGTPQAAREAGAVGQPAEDENDEDLEMFRAWLQSLKK